MSLGLLEEQECQRNYKKGDADERILEAYPQGGDQVEGRCRTEKGRGEPEAGACLPALPLHEFAPYQFPELPEL